MRILHVKPRDYLSLRDEFVHVTHANGTSFYDMMALSMTREAGIVAIEDKRLLGFLNFYEPDQENAGSANRSPVNCQIGDIFVDPGHHKQGIGHGLVQGSLAFLSTKHLHPDSHVMITVSHGEKPEREHALESLLLKSGFVPAGEEDFGFGINRRWERKIPKNSNVKIGTFNPDTFF